jgi:uncharacterized protein (DUF2236 family)
MIKLVVTVAGLALLMAALFLVIQSASPKQTAAARDEVQVPTDNIHRARKTAKQIEVETQQRVDGLMRKTE